MEADGTVLISFPVDGLPAKTTLTRTCPTSPHTAEQPMATSGTLEPV